MRYVSCNQYTRTSQQGYCILHCFHHLDSVYFVVYRLLKMTLLRTAKLTCFHSSVSKKPASHFASCSMSSSVLGSRIASASTLRGSGNPGPVCESETPARSCRSVPSCFSSSLKISSFRDPAKRSPCRRRGRRWKCTCGTVWPAATPSCVTDSPSSISKKIK